jgi:hypothetical protein
VGDIDVFGMVHRLSDHGFCVFPLIVVASVSHRASIVLSREPQNLDDILSAIHLDWMTTYCSTGLNGSQAFDIRSQWGGAELAVRMGPEWARVQYCTPGENPHTLSSEQAIGSYWAGAMELPVGRSRSDGHRLRG